MPTNKTAGTALAWPWKWTLYCPNKECDRLKAIPTEDGKYIWDQIPDRVTCPTCGKSYRVRPAIGTRERRVAKVVNGDMER